MNSHEQQTAGLFSARTLHSVINAIGEGGGYSHSKSLEGLVGSLLAFSFRPILLLG